MEHNAKVDPNPQPIGTSRFIYGRLCLLCLLAGICRWSACPEFGKSSIEFCPDSGGYHILAVNLVQGKGYVQGPVGSLDDYDERTRQLLDGEAVVPVGRSVFGRTPGYPLCVAAIYLVHGVDPNWVLTYQKCLAILAASMLPIVGWLVLRRIGDLLGVLVAIWLAQTPSAGYPISQLLTECLAQFLLVLAAVLAALAASRRPFAQLGVGLALAAATLTRPGLICVAVLHAFLLLLVSVSRRQVWACIFFCAPFLASLGVWTVYATSIHGSFVVLSPNSTPVMVAGIDPVRAAAEAGVPRPALTEDSLHDFWRCWAGGVPDPSILKYLIGVRSNVRDFLIVQLIKLRVAVHSVDRVIWCLGWTGATLLGMMMVPWPLRGTCNVDAHCRLACPAHRRGAAIAVFAGLASLVLTGVFVGSPVLQAALLGVPVLLLLFQLRVYCSDFGREAFVGHTWMLAQIGGFLVMTLMSIGNERFVRPFLPVIGLSAALCLPLMATFACAVTGARIRYAWHIDFCWACATPQNSNAETS